MSTERRRTSGSRPAGRRPSTSVGSASRASGRAIGAGSPRGRTSSSGGRGTSRPAVRPASAGGGRQLPKRRRPTSMRRMVTLGLLMVFLAVLLIPTLRGYLQQRSQIDALNEQVTGQQQTVNNLQRERNRWNDPNYVAQQARERLGFAKPGERAYIVIDDQGKKQQVEDVTGVRNDKAGQARPWYGQLWGSVVSSGEAPKVGSTSK